MFNMTAESTDLKVHQISTEP